MRHQLYLWQGLREKYIDDLKQLSELFYERIYPVFSNAEKEAEQYQNELWENVVNQPGADEDFDPSDYVDAVQDAAISRYEILTLMNYRNLEMWICCMCQIWEQQLYTFIISEARAEGYTYNEDFKNKGFFFVQKVFELHKQPLNKMKCWDEVRELRLLVNVIKHAEGDSEKKLRKIRPDYFKTDIANHEVDMMKLYHSSLLDVTLQITETDFKKYYDALIEFWNELPERMYWYDKC